MKLLMLLLLLRHLWSNLVNCLNPGFGCSSHYRFECILSFSCFYSNNEIDYIFWFPFPEVNFWNNCFTTKYNWKKIWLFVSDTYCSMQKFFWVSWSYFSFFLFCLSREIMENFFSSLLRLELEWTLRLVSSSCWVLHHNSFWREEGKLDFWTNIGIGI